jgi:hypothetical protein
MVDMTDLELVRKARPENLADQRDAASGMWAEQTPEQTQRVMDAAMILMIRLPAFVPSC